MSQLTDVNKTFKDLRENLQKIAGNGVLIGYTEMAPIYQKRIFVNGLSSSLSRIGTYSKKPAYFSLSLKSKLKGRANTGGLKAQGKKGPGAKFKNGKARKSMYIKTGYAGFRKVLWRQNSKVDLNLTGALSSSIKIGKKGGRIVYGFTNTDKADLASNLESKYKKKIFRTSRFEEGTAIKEATRSINEAIGRILK